MEKLVGQEIRCRITKLDVAEEDVVVDRRVVLEEEETARAKEGASIEVQEGDVGQRHRPQPDRLRRLRRYRRRRRSAPRRPTCPGRASTSPPTSSTSAQPVEVKILKINRDTPEDLARH